ncbi:hypothetical protein PHLCEN_2v12259 [Hermanssonia centrifuga]|uniref:Uncharacterized protein n=1 Tax=Hermanssonia centrifuga TaxID=98765 RepID=A0A2R6NHK1_9APHY|nr:hypothetical protein PHLCEN_2v12259 [Hermanssonia centrifuga]
MVDTRPSNATAHPGQVQIEGKRKRRTAAQMKSAKEAKKAAETAAKVLDVEKAAQQELLLHRIAELENKLVEGRAAARPPPPIRANLVLQNPAKGGPSASQDTAKDVKTVTPANKGQSAQPYPLSQPRTKYSRAEIATMRAALSTPTHKGAGVKAKMLVIPGQQAGGSGKRKFEAVTIGRQNRLSIRGFAKSYSTTALSSKGKGVEVNEEHTEGLSGTQSTGSKLANDDKSESAIDDFNDFSDGEFNEGEVKFEDEAIIISSDDDGEGGNNVPGRQLLFGHRMTTEGMVHIVDDQSSEAGSLDKIRPWPRLEDRQPAPTRKPVRSDLPIPYDQHKKFVKIYIRRVLRWLGEQPATFNVAYIDLLRPMQDAWDLTFPDYPHQIDFRGATYNITLQKTYDWRSAIGRSAIEILIAYLKKRTDLATDVDRTIWVEEMVKKGNKLPFLYARTEKMPDGNIERAITGFRTGQLAKQHMRFGYLYWGKTSLKYLHNTKTRVKPSSWRAIIIRARRSIAPAAAHAEFKEITCNLPDIEDDDYVLDDYTDDEWEGEDEGAMGMAMIVDVEGGEERTADG